MVFPPLFYGAGLFLWFDFDLWNRYFIVKIKK